MKLTLSALMAPFISPFIPISYNQLIPSSTFIRESTHAYFDCTENSDGFARLSPVQVWQKLLTYILEHHYGLTINDTPFSNDTTIQEHIEAGVNLTDAVNFLVERFELVRIDQKSFSWQDQEPWITSLDVHRAQSNLGLKHP